MGCVKEAAHRDLPVAVAAAVVLAKMVDSNNLRNSIGVCVIFWAG